MAKDLWSLLAKWWELDILICANISDWCDWLDDVHVAAKARLILEGVGGLLFVEAESCDCNAAYKYNVNSRKLSSLEKVTRAEKEESSEKKAEGSNRKKSIGRKRAKDKQEQESSKRQRVEDDKEEEELKKCFELAKEEDRKRLVNLCEASLKLSMGINWPEEILKGCYGERIWAVMLVYLIIESGSMEILLGYKVTQYWKLIDSLLECTL
ncbi:hypothetical protein Tco_0599789 [Tanacetum coccineum]